MRWKQQKGDDPRCGDTRIVRGFLFIPKLIGGEWRWLEVATWKQIYTIYWNEDGAIGYWEDVEENWLN
jgi:hypothetical protein